MAPSPLNSPCGVSAGPHLRSHQAFPGEVGGTRTWHREGHSIPGTASVSGWPPGALGAEV